MFVAYASKKGAAFIDRALYLLPREWADEPARREEAQVPEEARFATPRERSWPRGCSGGRSRRRGQRSGWWRTRSTGRPAAYDEGSWKSKDVRTYVLAVPETQGVSTMRDVSGRRERWPSGCLKRRGGTGLRGSREQEGGTPLRLGVCVSLPDPEAREAGRWLLLRRKIDDPSELAYYLAYTDRKERSPTI